MEVSRLGVGGMPLARALFAAQVTTSVELNRGSNFAVAALLLRLAGVSAADVMGGPYQPDITLRGFAVSPVMGLPQGLSVFVAGVRVNEPDASQVNFNLIPLHAVERVEVLRGPSGPFGKNALGGAINIVTRRGSARHTGTAEILVGSFAQAEGRAAVSGGASGFDYHLSNRYLRSDGWRDTAFTQLRHLFTRVGWRDERTDLWLTYATASDSILQAGSLPSSWLEDPGTIPARFRGDGDSRTVNFTGGDFFGPRLHFVTAGLTRHFASALSLDAKAILRRNRSTQFNANFTEPDIRIASAIRSVGGVAQLASRWCPASGPTSVPPGRRAAGGRAFA